MFAHIDQYEEHYNNYLAGITLTSTIKYKLENCYNLFTLQHKYVRKEPEHLKFMQHTGIFKSSFTHMKTLS